MSDDEPVKKVGDFVIKNHRLIRTVDDEAKKKFEIVKGVAVQNYGIFSEPTNKVQKADQSDATTQTKDLTEKADPRKKKDTESAARDVASRCGRRRLIPDDLDTAFVILGLPASWACPSAASTSMSERMYWGRRPVAKPPSKISLDSEDLLRLSNDKFCDSIVIRDHWLVIEGVQPVLPENVVQNDVKDNFSADCFYGTSSIFFNEIVHAVTFGSRIERERTLHTLETDKGLQYLVGRFVILISEGIRVNIGARNISTIVNLIKMTWSVFRNPHVRLERHLHILLPSVISCIVAKSLTISTAQALDKNNKKKQPDDAAQQISFEYRLRETCAKLLAKICDQFDALRLRLRVITVLKNGLTSKTATTTLYGAIYAIFAMGLLAVKTILLPRLHDIYCNIYGAAEDFLNKGKLDVFEMRAVELVMKILYEVECCEPADTVRTENYLTQHYGEFGTMLFNYLIEMKKLTETRTLVIDEGLWLVKNMNATQRRLAEKPKMTYSQYSVPPPATSMIFGRRGGPVSEDMLENLLDDSHHPWADVVKENGLTNGNAERKPSASGISQPKLVLIRKKSPVNQTEYVKPLEPIKVPGRPARPTLTPQRRESHAPGSISKARSMSTRVSRMVSMEDVTAQSSRNPAEFMRKFLSRPAPQAAAAVYGREMTANATKKSTVDQMIADSAFRLNTGRMKTAVVVQKMSSYSGSSSRVDADFGKFLLPSDPSSRL
ncbi:unnamed protein product [Caenorhabditis auriculariae]|uniref:TAF6 C-terminal HEAT repeat domain-containing protein n=1 Tax=Caenorhabditis auriculariae TaxID=2777116 RepID=A0A8S1HG46_9PELO|nr:unnamed protein product [Caenorhabditis auriculariae]